VALWITLAVSAAVSVLWAAGGLAFPNRIAYDELLRRSHARFAAGASSVVVFPVSQVRADAWHDGVPGARRDLARLIDTLAARQPLAIVINAALDRTSDEDDQTLAQSCRAAGNVVLRITLTSPRPSEYRLARLAPNLRHAAAGVGYVLFPPDPDGVVRRFSVGLPMVSALSLPVATWAVVRHTPWEAVLRAIDGRRLMPRLSVRPNPDGQDDSLLSFAAAPDHFPVANDPASVGGKVVIIGSTDVSIGGLTTPLALLNREESPVYMSSTEAVANATATLLAGHATGEPAPGYTLLFIVFLALVGAAASREKQISAGVVEVILLVWLWITIYVWLERYRHVLLPLAEPLTALAMAAIAGWAWRAVQHARDLSSAHAAAESERSRLSELDRAKRAVLSMVVHDLRNPVTVIKGQALTLASDPERHLGDAVHKEFLDSIAAQCDRLSNMVEDLLDVDPDRPLSLNLKPTDLVSLAERVADYYRHQHGQHHLVLEAAEPSVTLPLDADRILRVLYNVVGNAVKYSPQGGDVTIRVARDVARDEVVLAVRDEGIGMRPDQVAKLFGLFVRVLDDPRAIPGTGVGLFSAKRLVEAHGGRVEVSSTPGAGSEFRVYLPLAGPPPEPDPE
jgi:signal transduction histidine kinase